MPRAPRRSTASPTRAWRSTTCGCAAFRFPDEVRRFLESHETNFIVEQNRDGQLRSLLMLETGVPVEKLQSIRYYAGFPLSAEHVITGLKAKLEHAA